MTKKLSDREFLEKYACDWEPGSLEIAMGDRAAKKRAVSLGYWDNAETSYLTSIYVKKRRAKD